MSLRRLLSALFLGLCAVSLISATAVAQEEATPKWELFVGYQWLHPGITVPSPFQPASAPIGVHMGDIPEGAGASLNYNFTRFLGLEADYGVNKNDSGSVNTASIGPRLGRCVDRTRRRTVPSSARRTARRPRIRHPVLRR